MVNSTGNQPITFGGLVSGLDTKTMIQQLINAQKGPITIMQAKVNNQRSQMNAVKDVNNRLTNLVNKLKTLTDATALQGKTATVAAGGTSATVSASATTAATVSSFKVTVNQLADATRAGSTAAIGAAIDPGALLKDTNLATAINAGVFAVNGVSIAVDPNVDTLNDVIGRINASAAGVVASLVADSSGRLNKLQITGGSAVTLGGGADTTNFLAATNLLASPGTTTRTSTMNLGVTQTGAILSSARLDTALTQASGSFKVNGVAITYNSATDSMSTVLSRINNSSAGVTAAYDSVNDKITFVNKGTGSTAIALEDTTGNFLAATGVLGATQTLGKNAQFQVDTGSGPVTMYSTTNSVSNAVPGVSLSLLKEGAVADTVTVGQDAEGATARVRDVVAQFNSAFDFIKTTTKSGKDSTANGILTGDFSIAQIADSLRRLVAEPVDGITTGKTTLAEIGISFGAVGSAAGTTNLLQLDETKFKNALANDPAGVAQVLSAFKATAALDAGGTGGIDSISGDPTGIRRPGKYTVTTVLSGANADVTVTFKPDDGGQEVTTTAYGVTAGSSNTTLIPGTTLTFKGALTAGADTITVANPTRGVVAKLEQYLDPLSRGGGVLASRQTRESAAIERMNDQIDQMNDRLAQRQIVLQNKFARMESSLARLQSQRSALSALGLG